MRRQMILSTKKKRRKILFSILLVTAVAVLFGVLIYIYNEKRAALLDRKYAAETRNMTAEQVVQYYFKNWNEHNARAMQAVYLGGTSGMTNEFVTKTDYVKIMDLTQVPALNVYLQAGGQHLEGYAETKVYNVEFAIHYPPYISSGFSPEVTWSYVAVRKHPNDPWKISCVGFI